MEHVLSARQFNVENLGGLFDRADAMRDQLKQDGPGALVAMHAGKMVVTLFYEPSTRTRLSFESAAQQLGAGVISTENAAEFSSAAKGETLEDTIRTVAGYAHAIVIRHKEKGAAERAARVSSKPIINAGDGTGEHPTQALLDAYTIRRELGRLDNLHIVVGGDLAHGRTARSLVQLMARPNNRFSFVSTPALGMGDDIKAHAEDRGSKYTETDDLTKVLSDADVVYWTRLQKERLADPELESSFVIGRAALELMKQDAIIMHPLPRVGEISTEVDDDPRAAYFRQSENGLYLRMALLDELLS